MDLFSTTLTALAAPGRSVPIALCTAALLAVQIHYSGGLDAGLVPVALAIGFALLGPWSWRALVGRARRPVAGAALYVAEAIAVVASIGVALPALLDLGPTFLTDPGSLLIAVVLFLTGGWGLGRDIDLELDLERTRLVALRTHLDPHFLYNTLNAIAEWCVEDPRVAEEATLRLASMMREIVHGLELRAWPVARELALAENLLELHRLRDTDMFTISRTIDDEVAGAELPPLLLVALAENAVKHGPRKGHRGPIDVRVTSIPAGLRLEIENPGPFRPAEPGRGVAMLRRRLAHAYGSRARLVIEAVGPDRTRAVIELPRRPA